MNLFFVKKKKKTMRFDVQPIQVFPVACMIEIDAATGMSGCHIS